VDIAAREPRRNIEKGDFPKKIKIKVIAAPTSDEFASCLLLNSKKLSGESFPISRRRF
jgi:hypothetical protein